MKNKLELKHIAPYLLYGVKAYAFHYIMPKRYLEIIGIINDDIQPSNPIFKEDYDKIVVCKSLEKEDLGYTGNYPLFDIKPILRPLSDLTKEIEHNGEKFVPYNELHQIRKGVEVYKPFNINYPIELLIETENYTQEVDLFDGYLIIQKLIEWHFDVFGLIEKGLAVDINTIE